jgi:hypothetical protein
LPLGIAAAALLRRRLVPTRRRPPWSSFRPKLFLGALVLATVLAVSAGRRPWRSAALAAVATILVAAAQRALFLRAARRGALDGWVVRPTVSTDAAVPELPLLFGPPAGEIVERIPNPGYRETARVGVVRLTRRRVRSGKVVLALVLALFFALSLLLALLTMRSHA